MIITTEMYYEMRMRETQPQAGVAVDDVPDVLVHKREGVQFADENVIGVHLLGPGCEKTEGNR